MSEKITFPSPVPFNLLSSFFQNQAPNDATITGALLKDSKHWPLGFSFKPTYNLPIANVQSHKCCSVRLACKTVENFAPFDFSFYSCCRNDDLSCGAGSCSGQFHFATQQAFGHFCVGARQYSAKCGASISKPSFSSHIVVDDH